MINFTAVCLIFRQGRAYVTQYKFQTCAAQKVLPRGDLLFVAYMDVGKGREQDAEALLDFYLAH